MPHKTKVIIYLPPNNARQLGEIKTYDDSGKKTQEKQIIFDIIASNNAEGASGKLPITQNADNIFKLYTWKITKNANYPFRDADWILTISFTSKGKLSFEQKR